jgi:membrane-associated protease RseP (regulator of RpoE activity)
LEPQVRFRWRLSLFLFLATCASTYGVQRYLSDSWVHGVVYAATLMTILTAHEFGHYLQARRYGVPVSLPYFIPMPISLFGTLGAVILMRPRKAGPKALFDIAATGPIAGLVPALLASYFGLRWSQLIAMDATAGVPRLGEPLVFRLFSHLVFGPLPEGQDILLHPVAFAGWVGLFITALNLLPIGQLDGGHILYTLLGKKARFISGVLHGGAALLVVVDIVLEVAGNGGGGYWPWGLLVVLLFFLGVKHPPTADDSSSLDRGRTLLGWCLLLFVIVGFTPRPLIF